MTFTKLPKAISAEELLSTPLPPVKWIIPGLLPAGLALFAGPSKAGKSWLTLWLCLQIAQGNPVWDRKIEPRTVVYFSLEDTFNRLQNRIFQLIDGGDAPERLILQTECPSIGQGLEEQVESLIHTYRDVGLIVIDTLQKVRVSDGNGGIYANDYKEAGALKNLADKYGIHCRADHAWENMRAVQERFGKTDGVVALHAYQSFREGEVTQEQCHEIGVALARKVWGKRFQVLVATHMNTDNLHNHFVINSVSYVDGKKYEQRRSQYAEFRAASDKLCREYGLVGSGAAQDQGTGAVRPDARSHRPSL